ncbi:Brevican core protein [Nymphon striatum]|nr:Brevican core protein [Nymphon striatum]
MTLIEIKPELKVTASNPVFHNPALCHGGFFQYASIHVMGYAGVLHHRDLRHNSCSNSEMCFITFRGCDSPPHETSIDPRDRLFSLLNSPVSGIREEITRIDNIKTVGVLSIIAVLNPKWHCSLYTGDAEIWHSDALLCNLESLMMKLKHRYSLFDPCILSGAVQNLRNVEVRDPSHKLVQNRLYLPICHALLPVMFSQLLKQQPASLWHLSPAESEVDPDLRSWRSALEKCQALGPGHHLASITSNALQNYLLVYSGIINEDIWIGLNDKSNEGKFYWVDNYPVDYTNWDKYAPGYVRIFFLFYF